MNCSQRLLTKQLWIAIVLMCSAVSLDGQNVASPPKVAIKLQMYSPLSLLVQPFFDRKSHIPFTPRFYTGELEYDWSDQAGILFSLGIRRLRSEGGIHRDAYDTRTAFKMSLAYRNYPLSKRHGAISGLVLSPFARYLYGKRDYYGGIEFTHACTTTAISTGLQVGWQFRVKEHLLINLGIGPELIYQHRIIDELYEDNVTGLDYSGRAFWQRKIDYYTTKSIGLSPDVSIALGWLF